MAFCFISILTSSILFKYYWLLSPFIKWRFSVNMCIKTKLYWKKKWWLYWIDKLNWRICDMSVDKVNWFEKGINYKKKSDKVRFNFNWIFMINSQLSEVKCCKIFQIHLEKKTANLHVFDLWSASSFQLKTISNQPQFFEWSIENWHNNWFFKTVKLKNWGSKIKKKNQKFYKFISLIIESFKKLSLAPLIKKLSLYIRKNSFIREIRRGNEREQSCTFIGLCIYDFSAYNI